MEKVSKTWSEFFKSIQNEEFCEKLNKFLNNEYQEYSQALAVGGALHQACDIHNLHGGGNGALGLANIGQNLQPLVRHIGRPYIWLDGAEREVRALGLAGADAIEKSGFPDVRKPHDTAFQGHNGWFGLSRRQRRPPTDASCAD